MQELSNVVVDVSSVFQSNDDGAEVVIEKDDITSILGDIGTSDSHGKTDIGFGKGWCVIGTVTCYSDNLVAVLHTSNEDLLVEWGASSKNSEVFLDLVELVLVTDDLLLDSLFTFHNVDLFHASNDFSEFFTDHAGVFRCFGLFFGDDTSIDGDSGGSIDVITSAHDNGDSSFAASFDGICDALSKWILNTEDAEGAKSFFQDILLVIFNESSIVFLQLLELFHSQSSERSENGSVSIVGESLDGIIKALFVGLTISSIVIDWNSLSCSINTISDSLENHIWGSFAEDGDMVSSFDSNGSSLSFGGEWNNSEDIFFWEVGSDIVSFFASMDFHEEFDNTLFGNVSSGDKWLGLILIFTIILFNSSRAVEHNRLNDERPERLSGSFDLELITGIAEVVWKLCSVCWIIAKFVENRGVDSHDSHLILSEGSGFVRADVGNTSHGLRRGELTNQVVLGLHLSTRVRKGDSDGEWKTLWDSNDDHRDGNDQRVEEIDPESVIDTKSEVERLATRVSNAYGDITATTWNQFTHFQTRSNEKRDQGKDSA